LAFGGGKLRKKGGGAATSGKKREPTTFRISVLLLGRELPGMGGDTRKGWEGEIHAPSTKKEGSFRPDQESKSRKEKNISNDEKGTTQAKGVAEKRAQQGMREGGIHLWKTEMEPKEKPIAGGGGKWKPIAPTFYNHWGGEFRFRKIIYFGEKGSLRRRVPGSTTERAAKHVKVKEDLRKTKGEDSLPGGNFPPESHVS